MDVELWSAGVWYLLKIQSDLYAWHVSPLINHRRINGERHHTGSLQEIFTTQERDIQQLGLHGNWTGLLSSAEGLY